jgi:hypothetical protein
MSASSSPGYECFPRQSYTFNEGITLKVKNQILFTSIKNIFGMRIQIVSRNSHRTPAHRFNSRGYRTYWQKYGVNFTILFGVFYYARGRTQQRGNNIYISVGFEVLTAVVMKSTVFCDITPCSLLSVNRRFGGTSRLHLQGRKISRARNRHESDSKQSRACPRQASFLLLSKKNKKF